MFHKHHVKYFSETLKPIISVFLNAMLEHIGIDNIFTIEDIVKSKMEILKYCKFALINQSDNELRKIIFNKNSISYSDKTIKTEIVKIYDISKESQIIEPYVKTKLSLIQYETAIKVGEILNIPKDIILERLNNSS